MRSDDLTSVLAAGEKPDLGWRQGVIVAWDPDAGTNLVDIGGALISDVETLSSNGNIIYLPGDVVALIRFQTTWFVLGAIFAPGRGGQYFAPNGIGGPGDGAIASWPSTTSASYAELWCALVSRYSQSIGWWVRTSVGAGTTAQFSILVNGTEIANSGTYSAGVGDFGPNAAPWPSSVAYSFQTTLQVMAKRLSGSGTVACSLRAIYSGN